MVKSLALMSPTEGRETYSHATVAEWHPQQLPLHPNLDLPKSYMQFYTS